MASRSEPAYSADPSMFMGHRAPPWEQEKMLPRQGRGQNPGARGTAMAREGEDSALARRERGSRGKKGTHGGQGECQAQEARPAGGASEGPERQSPGQGRAGRLQEGGGAARTMPGGGGVCRGSRGAREQARAVPGGAALHCTTQGAPASDTARQVMR